MCDLDGEKLVIRDDDREEVIRERLEAYERQTPAGDRFFPEKGRRLFEIDADAMSPEAVLSQVCRSDQ